METQYKIQYLDSISLCWKDIQKRYSSKNDALKNGKRIKPNHELRVVEITRTSRTFGV
jgi:hypothetical protein